MPYSHTRKQAEHIHSYLHTFLRTSMPYSDTRKQAKHAHSYLTDTNAYKAVREPVCVVAFICFVGGRQYACLQFAIGRSNALCWYAWWWLLAIGIQVCAVSARIYRSARLNDTSRRCPVRASCLLKSPPEFSRARIRVVNFWFAQSLFKKWNKKVIKK